MSESSRATKACAPAPRWDAADTVVPVLPMAVDVETAVDDTTVAVEVSVALEPSVAVDASVVPVTVAVDVDALAVDDAATAPVMVITSLKSCAVQYNQMVVAVSVLGMVRVMVPVIIPAVTVAAPCDAPAYRVGPAAPTGGTSTTVG